MKKLAATLCIVGTAFALSACESTDTGDVQTAPPYASERTAGGEKVAAPAKTQPRRVQAERTFRQVQTK